MKSESLNSNGSRNYAGDGATVEAVRRTRGRPPGSKNKPKSKPRPTSPERAAMAPCVLELPSGADVISTATAYCRRRNVGLSLLSGNGSVSAVTLRQPSAASVTFRGRFDILSISATVLPPGDPSVSLSSAGSFTVFLAGPQGQVVGGVASGPLVAAGPVYLVAATFDRPSHFRLHQADPPPTDGGENGGAPIYSYQTSDVIWTTSNTRES